MTSMATSVVVLSSPALYDSNKKEHYFVTHFKPTDNVAGRSCYLKCCAILPQVTVSDSLDPQCVYFCDISFGQPLGIASVNNGYIGQSGTVTNRVLDHNSRIIGCFYPSGPDGGSHSYSSNSITYPRCLVHIPSTQQDVRVSIWKANGTPVETANLESLTIMFELTPIDGNEKPILNI